MAWKNRIVGSGDADPTQLLANPKNWRIHTMEQEAALSGVLSEVGLVDRIIVNEETNHVLNGHLRVAIAIREGEESVPVSYVSLTEAEEDLVLATFDPLSKMAGTDSEKLDGLLTQLEESEEVGQDEDVAELLEMLKSTPSSHEPESDEDAETASLERCPRCGYNLSKGLE